MTAETLKFDRLTPLPGTAVQVHHKAGLDDDGDLIWRHRGTFATMSREAWELLGCPDTLEVRVVIDGSLVRPDRVPPAVSDDEVM